MPKRERTVLEIARAGLVRSEHVEQSFLVQRLALIEPQYPELELLYAVPNGGLRSKAQAGKLRAEGVKASVPDLVLPLPKWPFHGLYVEMKKMGEHSTPAQRKFQGRLRGLGYAVLECQGDESAYRAFCWYLRLGGLPGSTWPLDQVRDARVRALDSLARQGVAGTIRVPDVVGPP